MDGEGAFQHEGDAEGQEQAVERVQPIDAADKSALQEVAKRANNDRSYDQRQPVANAEVLIQAPGDESSDHEERAMSEVDDPKQAKDDRQPE